MLEAAFPLQHRPGFVVVSGELGENSAEIDLAIARRAEAPSPLEPWLKARIDALPSARVEFGILNVKGADALVVHVDELQIIEMLQHEMRGIVIDLAALVAFDLVE